MLTAATSSTDVVVHHQKPKDQVFINFRGDELRYNFMSHIRKALERERINVFIDTRELMGKDQEIFFQRIEESKIAIAVMSRRYTESQWCLNELVKIQECVEAKTLAVFPVFYKVDPKTVKDQNGSFGDNFRELVKKDHNNKREEPWKEALKFVTQKTGMEVKEKSDEGDEIVKIVERVKELLNERREISPVRESEVPRGGREPEPKTPSDESDQLYGIETRVEQLKEKLELKSENVTRVIGIVGMPGIGKTTLAKKLFECGGKFQRKMFLDVSQKPKPFLDETLHTDVLLGLWKSNNNGREGREADLSLDNIEDQLKETKVFVVLDNVRDKSQLDKILGRRKWIKKGSKIVITTSSKSVIQEIESTYPVLGLSDCDALEHFNYHAFSGSDGFYKQSFTDLAKEFVEYSRGHPSVLKIGEIFANSLEFFYEYVDPMSLESFHEMADETEP